MKQILSGLASKSFDEPAELQEARGAQLAEEADAPQEAMKEKKRTQVEPKWPKTTRTSSTRSPTIAHDLLGPPKFQLHTYRLCKFVLDLYFSAPALSLSLSLSDASVAPEIWTFRPNRAFGCPFARTSFKAARQRASVMIIQSRPLFASSRGAPTVNYASSQLGAREANYTPSARSLADSSLALSLFLSSIEDLVRQQTSVAVNHAENPERQTSALSLSAANKQAASNKRNVCCPLKRSTSDSPQAASSTHPLHPKRPNLTRFAGIQMRALKLIRANDKMSKLANKRQPAHTNNSSIHSSSQFPWAQPEQPSHLDFRLAGNCRPFLLLGGRR